jgi:hypothetical protein
MAVATTETRTHELTPISEVLDAVEQHRNLYQEERLKGADGEPEKLSWRHTMSDPRALKVARILHFAANTSADYLDRLVDLADLVCEATGGYGSPDNEPELVALLAKIIKGLGFDADEYFMVPSELKAAGYKGYEDVVG